MTDDAYKYWAFISYSHRDKAAGEWLHRSLEAYRIAKPVQGRKTLLGPVPARLVPVFRDREELAAAPDLGDRIEAALKQSRFVIVVCSPASAASPWVNKEITFFKSLGREGRIFSLIAEGEPYASETPGREGEECFPKALRHRLGADGQISSARAEPLAADIRADKDGKQNALLKLIAGMLGIGFDELRQRQLEARNAWLRKVVAASVALVLVFATVALYAFAQQRLAEQRMRLALSRQLAVQSGTLLQTSPDLPMLLGLEALFADDTVEARRSLFDALMVNRRPMTFLHSPVKMQLSSMTLSRDGKTLVSAGREGQLVFWDLATDPPQTRVEQSGKGVNDMSVNEDGKLLAIAETDGVIGLWDLTSRRRAASPKIPKQPGDVAALTFGPRNLLAFGYSAKESYDARKLVLWDLAAGSAQRTINTRADGAVSSLAFSPDGKTLASAAVGGDTTLWDVATGNDVHSDFLKDTASLAFSPDGKWLASGSWELTLRNTENFDAVSFPLPDAPAHIGAVRFSPDGKLIVSASSSGNLVVWDAAGRRPLEEPFQLKMGSLNGLALSPSGRTIYAGSDEGQIAIVRLDTTPLRKLVRTGEELVDVSFNPATGEVASIDDKGNVSFWDASSLEAVRRIPASPGAAAVIAVSPDGATLAVGDYKGWLTFWDAKAAKQLSEPAQVKTDRIDRIRFTPDGLTVAILGIDPEVALWDVKGNQRAATPLVADSSYARDAVFSNDGNRLFTVGDDGKILEWDWRAAERIGSPMKSPSGAGAIALSPDGKLLAVGGYDNRVTLWEVTQKQKVGVALVAHTNFVRTISFSPDGKLIATGGDDGLAILWDVKTRQPIAQFKHGASVLSGDGSARTARAVNRVSFSADGTMLAADGLKSDILLWDVDVTSWQRQACQRMNRNLSPEEWSRYLGDTPHLETCPGGLPRIERTR